MKVGKRDLLVNGSTAGNEDGKFDVGWCGAVKLEMELFCFLFRELKDEIF